MLGRLEAREAEILLLVDHVHWLSVRRRGPLGAATGAVLPLPLEQVLALADRPRRRVDVLGQLPHDHPLLAQPLLALGKRNGKLSAWTRLEGVVRLVARAAGCRASTRRALGSSRRFGCGRRRRRIRRSGGDNCDAIAWPRVRRRLPHRKACRGVIADQHDLGRRCLEGGAEDDCGLVGRACLGGCSTAPGALPLAARCAALVLSFTDELLEDGEGFVDLAERPRL
mmetsp:Transcript_27394/g.81842  ORF Transcript_27394/g.81842 Transcript_27394/m.81842 type:complete len:226 (+) Transcript_27394:537-1214(+)